MKKDLITLTFVFLFSLNPACRQGTEPPPTPTETSEMAIEEDSPISEETKSTDEEIKIKKIQVELITSSDWADLYILNPDQILSFEIVSVIGEPTFHYGGSDKLTLEQPMELAESGASVGIIVNYEIKDDISTLDFKSQRGGLNENQVRIFDLSDDEPALLQEIDHNLQNDQKGILEFSLVLQETVPAEPDVVSVDSKVDLIFYNGTLLTIEDNAIASAIAIEDGVILVVGSDEEVLQLAETGTKTIDLEGRTLMPGFVDPHSHNFSNPWRDDLDGGQTYLLSVGNTTTGELLREEELIQEFQALDQDGKLRMRVSLYPNHIDSCGNIRGDWYSEKYTVSRESGAMLQIPGIKIFNDGGSCNVPAVSYEYEGGYGHGDLYFQADELAEMIISIQKLGYQVAIHGLGDRAIEVNLDAIEIALGGGPNTYHHRIEHNAIVRDDMLQRYSEVDVVALIFGYFPACFYIGETKQYKYVTPSEYSDWELPWRSLIDVNPNVHFVWHADSPPMGDPVPMKHLHGFVTRTQVRDDGTVCEPPDWAVDDLLTVEEALPLMTIEGAYALLLENEIGSLKAGKLADLIILSENPLLVDTADLLDIQVLMTMVGGNVEHCMPGYESLCP